MTMFYVYEILSEPLMHVWDDDDDHHGGQRSTEVKYRK